MTEKVFIATVSFTVPQLGRFQINGRDEAHVREQLEVHRSKCKDMDIVNIVLESDIEEQEYTYTLDPKEIN